MSETIEVKANTIESVTKEYTQVCANLGDAQYKLRSLEKFIANSYAVLDKLDGQAFELNKAANADPKVTPIV